MARVAGQRLTALLLLVVSLLLPSAPLLQAKAASAELCQCCRRKGNDACRRSHTTPASGPSWNASPDCMRGCALPVGLAFSTPFLAPYALRADGLPRYRYGSLAPIRVQRFAPSYIAWRYQRPPPLL
jgi:hypothetical protein